MISATALALFEQIEAPVTNFTERPSRPQEGITIDAVCQADTPTPVQKQCIIGTICRIFQRASVKLRVEVTADDDDRCY